MERKRWEKLEALFHRAMTLPPDHRAIFVNTACIEDHELRRELQILVNAAGESEAYFDRLWGRKAR